MPAKKVRPRRDDPVEPGMSVRDVAASLGVSKSEVSRWVQLARLPEAEFETRLRRQLATNPWHTTGASVLRDGPSPRRDRVERAQSLLRSMTPDELTRFLEWLAEALLSEKSRRSAP